MRDNKICSHRLKEQDIALSRLKYGFESRWEYQIEQLKFKIKCIYKFYAGLTVSSVKAETGDKLVTFRELCQ